MSRFRAPDRRDSTWQRHGIAVCEIVSFGLICVRRVRAQVGHLGLCILWMGLCRTFGGLLCDQTGLGKTVSVLLFLAMVMAYYNPRDENGDRGI